MTCDTRRATLVQRLAITLPCAVSAIFLAVPAIAEDGDSLSAIPHGEAPLQVSVGFNLINLTDVNEKEETIDFEGGAVHELDGPPPGLRRGGGGHL